jgi:hypothetical protein
VALLYFVLVKKNGLYKSLKRYLLGVSLRSYDHFWVILDGMVFLNNGDDSTSVPIDN